MTITKINRYKNNAIMTITKIIRYKNNASNMSTCVHLGYLENMMMEHSPGVKVMTYHENVNLFNF